MSFYEFLIAGAFPSFRFFLTSLLFLARALLFLSRFTAV